MDSVIPFVLDEEVRARIVAEAGGNPLALLELPRGLSAGAAGRRLRVSSRDPRLGANRGDVSAAARGVAGGARGLMLVAAAEPVGNPVVVLQAARMLGIAPRQ